jgi:hypothetical protein
MAQAPIKDLMTFSPLAVDARLAASTVPRLPGAGGAGLAPRHGTGETGWSEEGPPGMRPTARRDRIMELLVEHRRLTVEELAQQLGASPETIRRDLTELAARDVLRKFHGGAALPESGAKGAFQARMAENLPAKRAIARRAAGLFATGDTIFVDTGSTTIAFAAALA